MLDPSRAADLPPTRRESLGATPSAFAAEQSTSPTSGLAPITCRVAGQRFGHYELLEQVACGGMGIVYKARDLLLGRVVALKMIRSGLLAQPEEVQRFYREAQAAAQLSHINIVPIHEIGEHDGRHYFTMAFAPGGSLAQERGPATEPHRAAARVEKVARAVQYAHDRGILHRDLKPANVLLDEHGEPLVADFGLAKFLDSEVELTHDGQVLGTPAYMAPEQAPGGGGVTRQADVWALGVLLYELLTGQRPFACEGREELWRAIRTADPVSPRSRRPDLDRALETIILKCLEKDPARRYGSAGDLADDLARWQSGESILAQPEPWPRRAWRAVRRRGRLWAAVALLALAAGGIGLFLVVNDPDRPLRAAQARLASGQRATLIAETGPPAWSAMRYGQATTKLATAADGTFKIHAWDSCLLELLRDPQCDRFRFEAEVEYDNARDENNQAGIYCAYSQHCPDRSQQPYHSAIILRFSKLPPDPADKKDPNRRHTLVRLDLDSFRGPWPVEGGHFSCVIKQFPIPDKERPEDVWHALALEVSPEVVRAFWDGQLLGEVPRPILMQDTNYLVHPAEGPALPFEPPFRPRQPLGLYVHGGVAWVRNVVVEPFPEQPTEKGGK